MTNDNALNNMRKIVREMMAAGSGGFTNAANEKGPVAGYDPVMSKPLKRKLKKVKDLRN
jgi:hypothetical protein|tara:strand:- start:2071 stop:2247 length:177 start_codon:yes stop_codon:yes gene_type:complete